MKIDTKTIVLSCMVVLLLLFAAAPAAADMQVYSPVQDQARAVLIDQISGTEMTSGQYIQTVWPEVYQKLSPVDKVKLASVQQVWGLKSLNQTEGGRGVSFTLDDPQMIGRVALKKAIEHIDISEAEYMQIVWPELYADLDVGTRLSLSQTTHKSGPDEVSLLGTRSVASTLSLQINPLMIKNGDHSMYINLKSYASWGTNDGLSKPKYHYVEFFIYGPNNVEVGTAAYGKRIEDYSSSMDFVEAYNQIIGVTPVRYHGTARGYAIPVGFDTNHDQYPDINVYAYPEYTFPSS